MMNKPTTSEVMLWIVILAIFVLWIVWATCGITISDWFLNGATPADAGAWADSFGAFNALVSSFALAGVLLTLALQNRAIREQQREAEKQVSERHKQQFEGSFFQLLELMRDVRSEVYYKYSDQYAVATSKSETGGAKGAAALIRAAREAEYWIKERRKTTVVDGRRLGRIYETRVHRRYESRLGPYYRIIYTILRRISEDSILSDQEKQRYGNVVRSQLQGREVLLLGLNGLAPMSNDFAKYLVEFRMMKYLPTKSMKEMLMIGYPVSAFEPRD